MCRLIIVLLIVSVQQKIYANNPSVDYITQYKKIAVAEMHRTGIPASIKMAQALLESGAGRSTLATKANNHFGIKCGGSWGGDTFYREDDDYDSNGKLMKSCFRKFDSVIESYMAHSNFLTNQRRYESLFGLARDDYKGWAKGLRKAGYATDKKYTQKLIEIIEKYELYNLDFEGEGYLAESDDYSSKLPDNSQTDKRVPSSSDVASTSVENRKSSSSSSKTRTKNYDANAEVHTVLAQQSIAEIAMIYNLDENAIRLRNRLPKDAEPVPGEKIYLRKKISLLKRPKFTRQPNGILASSDNEFIF